MDIVVSDPVDLPQGSFLLPSEARSLWRRTPLALSASGLALACLGLFWLSRLDTDSTVGEIVGCLVLTGLGQGLFQSPNTRALMNAAPGNERGEASGLMTTGRVLGQSLSVAVAGAIFTGLGGAAAGRALAVAASNVPVAAPEIAAFQHTFLAGFHAALTVATGLAAVGIFVALVRGDEGRFKSASTNPSARFLLGLSRVLAEIRAGNGRRGADR